MPKNTLADTVAEEMNAIMNSDSHASLFHKDAKKKVKPCCDCKSCGKKCPCEDKCKKSCSCCADKKTDKEKGKDKSKTKEKGKGFPFFGKKKLATVVAQLTEDLAIASEVLDSLGLTKSATSTLQALDGMLEEIAMEKLAATAIEVNEEEDVGKIDDPTLEELGLKSEEPMGSLRSGDIAREILEKNPDLKGGLKNELLQDRSILQPYGGIEADSLDPEIISDEDLGIRPDTDIDEILQESLSPTQFPSDFAVPNLDALPEDEALKRELTETVRPGNHVESSVKDAFVKLASWVKKHAKSESEEDEEDFEDEE